MIISSYVDDSFPSWSASELLRLQKVIILGANVRDTPPESESF
jgi:hypothetical protein